MNGFQRTPTSVTLYQEVHQDKQLFLEKVRELRILLTSEGILLRYNEALTSLESRIIKHLDERANLYRERDFLDNQIFGQSDEEPVRDLSFLALPHLSTHASAVTRATNSNKTDSKNENKNGHAAMRLMPKVSIQTWKTLKGAKASPKYLYHEKNPQKKVIKDSLQECFLVNKNAQQERVSGTALRPYNSSAWMPIPNKFKAYPSYFEQIHCLHNKSNPSKEVAVSNYYTELSEDYLDEMSSDELIDLARMARDDIDNEMEDSYGMTHSTQNTMQDATFPSTATQKSPVITAGVDDLDQILGLSQIPVEDVPVSPPASAHLSKSSPSAVTKVSVDVTLRNFPKTCDKQERLVKLWSIAKKFDKQVVLCPVVNEPLPVLRHDNEIRTCLIYKYFQDRVPLRKQQKSFLQGFVTFGITTDEKDFVSAMKDWANSYGHDISQTDRPATTMVAGFLTQMSITTNKAVAEDQIKRTKEYSLLGKPRFCIRVSTVYGKSINGGPDKAPAWCVESAREDIDEVVKLCETVFTGDNKQLPSCLRKAVYLPTRSLPVGHPTRQGYILSQLAFLNSELTVTCQGLKNIYNMVRLRQDSTIQTSVEDVLMSIPAVSGKLLRSIDMAHADDSKVFFKLDEINLSSWVHRSKELASLIQTIVLPEDHIRVFDNTDGLLSFSDPWRKIKDGKPVRNVFAVPKASSVAYAESMLQKLPGYVVTETVAKKRAHSGSKAETGAVTAVDLTGDDTPVSSPSHKVHVVEQRSASTAPNSGNVCHAGLQDSSGNQTRIDKLESIVKDHGHQLGEIRSCVADLDSKIFRNHEETRYAFNDFRSVLMDIRGAMSGVAKDGKEQEQPAADAGSPGSERTGVSESYNPIAEQAMWRQKIREHESELRVTRANRAAYEQMLAREGTDGGGAKDFSQVAYQRYPSSVMERIPDDITLHY